MLVCVVVIFVVFVVVVVCCGFGRIYGMSFFDVFGLSLVISDSS